MAHILLVEDSPEVSLSVREILSAAGHSVEDAATGKQALVKLKAGKFDAVISDIWMPEMDGIAFLKAVRGSGNKIPVVVISGGAPNAPLTYTAPLASTFGANVVLYKPFEKAELLSALARATLFPCSRPATSVRRPIGSRALGSIPATDRFSIRFDLQGLVSSGGRGGLACRQRAAGGLYARAQRPFARQCPWLCLEIGQNPSRCPAPPLLHQNNVEPPIVLD